MPQSGPDVLLVGSVPLETAREVFQTCSTALGNHLVALPDGEVGARKSWIQCQALLVFDGHPALETITRPKSADRLASGYDDNWSFRLRPDVGEIKFEDLRYARWAMESYDIFREMRQRGDIPATTRFQVSLPTPLGGSVSFFQSPEDRELVYPAYEAAMLREVATICAKIPHRDLALQWDVCLEILEIAAGLHLLATDPWTRTAAEFGRIARAIPADVMLGFHFCYGDLAHHHMVEPDDLGLSVRMAALAIAQSNRRVDWIHLPVPINRSDDAYFAPLRDLPSGDAKVFLGLIHLEDGVQGSLGRARVARRHLKSFGVATECGLGRRPGATLPELLRIHREIADQLQTLVE
jgi:hypothetical protein